MRRQQPVAQFDVVGYLFQLPAVDDNSLLPEHVSQLCPMQCIFVLAGATSGRLVRADR
jgi:hypothetical protein